MTEQPRGYLLPVERDALMRYLAAGYKLDVHCIDSAVYVRRRNGDHVAGPLTDAFFWELWDGAERKGCCCDGL